MDYEAVVSKLAAAGSAEGRRRLGELGVRSKAWGVDLEVIQEWADRIGVDHGLALQLWRTENHDARRLACRIVAIDQCTARMLQEWSSDCDDPLLAGDLEALADQAMRRVAD